MSLQEMYLAVNRRVDDTAVQADVYEWLDEAKNKLGIAVGANFPSVEDIDSKWQGLLVLFACARYKEQDAILSEATNFLNQFYDGLKDFIAKYEVPAQYRDDHTSQQFTATTATQTFTITKQTYNSVQGDLVLYKNNVQYKDFVANSDNTFTAYNLTAGDLITAIWEEHVDLVQPPYSFWGRW